jgi:hypothetical protein
MVERLSLIPELKSFNTTWASLKSRPLSQVIKRAMELMINEDKAKRNVMMPKAVNPFFFFSCAI